MYTTIKTTIERGSPKPRETNWLKMPQDSIGEVIATCDERIVPLGALVVECNAGLVVFGNTVRSWVKGFDHRKVNRGEIYVRLLTADDVVQIIVRGKE